MTSKKTTKNAYRAYLYGFNGKELENEIKGTGNTYDYGARFYDAQLGRFHSVDPLAGKHPDYSSYAYVYNNPIKLIDIDGRDTINPIKNSFAFKVFYQTEKGKNFVNNFVSGKYKDHTLILKEYSGYKDGYTSSKVIDGKIETTIAIDQVENVSGVETLGHEAFLHAERKIKELDKVIDNRNLSKEAKEKKISKIQKSSFIFYKGQQAEYAGDIDHSKLVNGTAYSYFKYINQASSILKKKSPSMSSELNRQKNASIKQYSQDKWIQWYLKIGDYKYRK